MIPAAELAPMQSVAASALDIAGCQVQRKTIAPDAYGHQTEQWNTLSTVSCGLAKPTTALMQEYAGLIGALATWVASLPYGTTIQRDDQLVIPSLNLTLRVQADLSQVSYAVLAQVLATEVR